MLFFGNRVLHSNASIETFVGCLRCSCGVEEVTVDRSLILRGTVEFGVTLGSDLSFSSSDIDIDAFCDCASVVMQPNCSDRSTSALRIASPTFRDGYTVEGGY